MRRVGLLVAFLLVGCGTSTLPSPSSGDASARPTSASPTPTRTSAPTPTSTPEPTASPLVAGDFRGEVELPDGRLMHLVCEGDGQPTVVLDAGLQGSVSDWTAVIAAASATTRVCAYNRIGTPPSSRATEPRTTAAIVEDLRTLLATAGIPTPVVLVGHSIAGLDLRLHAGRYPDEVAGLLFVDPAAPDLDEAWLAALPPPDPDDPDILKRLRDALEAGAPPPDAIGERYDIAGSAADVLAVTSFGDIPTTVLSAEVGPFADYPGPVGDALDEVWLDAQRQLGAMSTDGRLEVVRGARHSLQQTHPEVVADAIAELVAKARGR